MSRAGIIIGEKQRRNIKTCKPSMMFYISHRFKRQYDEYLKYKKGLDIYICSVSERSFIEYRSNEDSLNRVSDYNKILHGLNPGRFEVLKGFEILFKNEYVQIRYPKKGIIDLEYTNKLIKKIKILSDGVSDVRVIIAKKEFSKISIDK